MTLRNSTKSEAHRGLHLVAVSTDNEKAAIANECSSLRTAPRALNCGDMQLYVVMCNLHFLMIILIFRISKPSQSSRAF